jgi:DNA polymerase I-like protein with 3'-5' exonuclease and polymerase domains
MIELPNLSSAKLIGYDTETFDPYLSEDGPGWGRGAGYVLGVALAVDEQNKWYIPLGEHPPEAHVRYLRDTLGTDTPKTGANLQYDYGWLAEIGIWPGGLQMDIQFAEALLDDVMLYPNGRRRSFSLDSLAMDYLGKQKEKFEIEAYCQERWPRSKDFRENLWKCPVEHVAPYAMADAALPIEIIKQQWSMLSKEDLLNVFELECKLIPLLVRMRMNGMPVDLEKAQDARDEMLYIEKLLTRQISELAGFYVNVNSSKDLEVVFDRAGVEYPRTAKGNPSFTADFLKTCDAPIAGQILELRQVIKARSTFIENAIMQKHINGKIYPSLHPLRSDDSGTISGRFSCSQPNGQQIPKRNAIWAPIIRGIFIPSEGYPLYASLDLSQIEYRIFAHHSGDKQLIEKYQDPNTDFHAAVGEIIGGNLPRLPMKTINFGLLYGMGKAKLTKQLATLFPDDPNPLKRALEIYDIYQTRFPAAAKLLKAYASQVSKAPHETRTILGRKSRFRLWEPNTPGQYDGPAYLLPIAINKWGRNIRIAGSYKAINRVLQGSAADLMKKGMVDAYEAGIFEKIGYPHITVHDELCHSFHPDLVRGFQELRECVETCIALKVPIRMGLAVGPSWGEVQERP